MRGIRQLLLNNQKPVYVAKKSYAWTSYAGTPLLKYIEIDYSNVWIRNYTSVFVCVVKLSFIYLFVVYGI